MPTTFDLFYLGIAPEIDTVEGNSTSENHEALQGSVFGGSSTPLASDLRTLSPDATNSYTGGASAAAYDSDNLVSNEQFIIDGVTRTHDATMIYTGSQITYTDGTLSEEFDAIVMQDTDGNLYLLPPTSGPNAYSDALEAKPIESLTLGTANPTNGDILYSMAADRYDLDVLNYVVDGTAGDDLIDVSYTGDPEGDRIDNTDNLNGTNDDSVVAGAGDDTVFSGDGNDTVLGEDGNDLLDGGAGDDSLIGGAGQDTFIGGEGADTFEGGAGLDIVDYSDSASAVNVDLSTNTFSGGDAEGDTATGVDGIIGSDFDDTLTGFDGELAEGGPNDFTNVIDGGAGNDTISGLDGADTLIGGAGDDSIDGGAGDDTIHGDQAPQPGVWDYQVYDYDFDNIGFQAFDIENGTLVGEGQTSTFDATTLVNDARDTTGDPDDFGMIYTSQLLPDEDGTYTFSTTSDDGSTIRILDENGDPLTWTNEDGTTATYMDNDRLQGANTRSGEVTLDADKIYTIEVRHWENIGNEVISGTVTSPSGTTEDLADSSMIIGPETTAGDDILSGGDGNDMITGGGGNDYLDGGTGQDTLLGGAGQDTLVSTGFNDTLDGGADADLIDIDQFDPAGSMNLNADGGSTGDDNDTLDISGLLADGWTITNFTQNPDTGGNPGFSGQIQLSRDGETATINYTDIENFIIPDFVVEGTSGADTIDASYTGDPDGDRIDNLDHSDGSNADSVRAGDGDDVVLSGDGDDTVFGEDGADSIEAGAGDDIADGGDGDDTLNGLDGSDTLLGGEGADSIGGGADSDLIQGDTESVNITDYTSPPGDTATDLTVTNSADAPVELLWINESGVLQSYATIQPGETFVQPTFENHNWVLQDPDGNIVELIEGAPNQTVDYGAGGLNDSLQGGAGNDTIEGQFGDDTLDGGIGDDTLVGQSGDDTFLLSDNFGNDSIIGGETGETDGDTLDLSNVTTDTTVDQSGPDPDSGTISDGNSTATFSEIENIVLGSGDDTYIGSSGADNVIAGDGNDSLDGGAGPDSLDGGVGDDTIIVDQGDTVTGGEGDDTFILQDLDTTGTGNDPISITGGEGGETDGDTLILTQDVAQSDIVFSNEDDTAGGLSGSFTMGDGTVVQFSEIENIICFTPGTNILTQHGERPIETLRIGDMVVTRDHGLRQIRWIGHRSVRGHGDFAPVRIGTNVMDGARCGLLVSPQHRILFSGYRAELLFGESEVLVPAKHLIDGLEVVQETHDEVTYIHIMFDSHEVIYAEGIATESFHAGDVGLSAICEAARDELFAIFPELRTAPGHHLETARTCLKRHEARLLVHQTGKTAVGSLWCE